MKLPYSIPPEIARARTVILQNKHPAAAIDMHEHMDAWSNEGGAPKKHEPKKLLRVLVMEDDAMIGMLLAEMLEVMGYEVCAVEATEADSVAAAARCKPDLMIVDARLGDGSGISAVETISRTGAVPHLFVSGDISRIKPLRPDAVMLQKPYDEADLARAIQRTFDSAASA